MHPTSEMMSKCRKWHLREPKFAKFHGGACPQTPLEARAFGERVSASGAKKYLPKHKRTPLNRIHPTGLDSQEMAAVKTCNSLLPIYREELRDVLLEDLKWMRALEKDPIY